MVDITLEQIEKEAKEFRERKIQEILKKEHPRRIEIEFIKVWADIHNNDKLKDTIKEKFGDVNGYS